MRIIISSLAIQYGVWSMLSAATMDDLTISGYVDVRSEYANSEQNTGHVLDTRAEMELRLGWSPSQHVWAQLDIEHNNLLEDPTVEKAANETTVEQAFIHWQLNDEWDVTIGRFSTWLGWEDPDPDTRWRVRSPFEWLQHDQSVLPFAYPYRRLFYGIDEETGVILGWRTDDYSIVGYVIDAIWVPKDGTSKTNDELGYGIEFMLHTDTVEAMLQGTFETGTRDSGAGDDFGAIANVEWRIGGGLEAVAEIALFDYHFDQALGGFIALRSTAHEHWQPSVQFSYMDTGNLPNIVSGAVAGTAAYINETTFMEISTSVFFFPEILSRDARLGCELAYQISSTEVDDDALSITLQFVAMMP